MSPERFKTYDVEDFIFDEEFRRIFKNPIADKLINEFTERFPEKKQEIIIATDIIKGLKTIPFTQSSERKNKLWLEIVRKSRNEN